MKTAPFDHFGSPAVLTPGPVALRLQLSHGFALIGGLSCVLYSYLFQRITQGGILSSNRNAEPSKAILVPGEGVDHATAPRARNSN